MNRMGPANARPKNCVKHGQRRLQHRKTLPILGQSIVGKRSGLHSSNHQVQKMPNHSGVFLKKIQYAWPKMLQSGFDFPPFPWSMLSKLRPPPV